MAEFSAQLQKLFSEDKECSQTFLVRAILYVIVLFLISVFSNSYMFESSAVASSKIFLIFSFLAFGQLMVSFQRHVGTYLLFVFFLMDGAVAMFLVRLTGWASSPFTILFPLLSLSSSVVFRSPHSYILVLVTLVFQIFSVGFGPSLLGNAFATVVTGVLGMYLVRALDRSGAALKVSEGARRRLENLQKAIVTNIPSGLMSVDSRGNVIQINEVGLKILGVEENRILYARLKDFFPEMEEVVGKLNTLYPHENNLEASAERPSVRYRSKGGDSIYLGYNITRLSDPEDGSVMGSLIVFQDLTKILKMEEDLRTSEKLAAVGKLAAGIAHEIRNPLASISGSAQLLITLEDLGEEDQKLLSIIQRESTRLDTLISEFLEYVRPQKPKADRVNLSQLVKEVAESMKVNTKWKLLSCELKLTQLTSGDIFANGDANKITQVLINLVLNAGQAKSKLVEIILSADAKIKIVDDGVGISPVNQKRLFEPFFTTKEQGTGLGLATTYRALEAMGAKISFVSPRADQGGTGTIFILEFKANRE